MSYSLIMLVVKLLKFKQKIYLNLNLIGIIGGFHLCLFSWIHGLARVKAFFLSIRFFKVKVLLMLNVGASC